MWEKSWVKLFPACYFSCFDAKCRTWDYYSWVIASKIGSRGFFPCHETFKSLERWDKIVCLKVSVFRTKRLLTAHTKLKMNNPYFTIDIPQLRPISNLFLLPFSVDFLYTKNFSFKADHRMSHLTTCGNSSFMCSLVDWTMQNENKVSFGFRL